MHWPIRRRRKQQGTQTTRATAGQQPAWPSRPLRPTIEPSPVDAPTARVRPRTDHSRADPGRADRPGARRRGRCPVRPRRQADRPRTGPRRVEARTAAGAHARTAETGSRSPGGAGVTGAARSRVARSPRGSRGPTTGAERGPCDPRVPRTERACSAFARRIAGGARACPGPAGAAFAAGGEAPADVPASPAEARTRAPPRTPPGRRRRPPCAPPSSSASASISLASRCTEGRSRQLRRVGSARGLSRPWGTCTSRARPAR